MITHRILAKDRGRLKRQFWPNGSGGRSSLDSREYWCFWWRQTKRYINGLTLWRHLCPFSHGLANGQRWVSIFIYLLLLLCLFICLSSQLASFHSIPFHFTLLQSTSILVYFDIELIVCVCSLFSSRLLLPPIVYQPYVLVAKHHTHKSPSKCDFVQVWLYFHVTNASQDAIIVWRESTH